MKFTANTAPLQYPIPFPYSASPPQSTTSSVTTVTQPSTTRRRRKLRRRLDTTANDGVSDELKNSVRDAICHINGDYFLAQDRCTNSVTHYSTTVTDMDGEFAGTQQINITFLHQPDAGDYSEFSDSDEKYASDSASLQAAVADGSLHDMFFQIATTVNVASDSQGAQIQGVDVAEMNTVHSHVTVPATDDDDGGGNNKKALSAGAIGGIVVGAVAVLALSAGLVLYMMKRVNSTPLANKSTQEAL